MKRVIAMLLAAALLTGCGAEEKPAMDETAAETLRVEPVDDLPEDFILGMDASCVPSLEAGGVIYTDHDGQARDVFAILRDNGINYIRVRIWNDPFTADGRGYGGGNCDLENAKSIGQRAAQYGLKLLVNFHYSDFWADPGKQMVPKAWQGMDMDSKTEALYRYTADALQQLLQVGADIGMVQIGNETNGAFCGEYAGEPEGWQRITQLMNAGARAVRAVCPDALVAVHFTNPEKTGSYLEYGKQLENYQVDYDVFASSYYPFWHGSLDNLSAVLSQIAETYDKKVMVAETSCAYTATDTDFFANTVGEGYGTDFSEQTQADLVRDVIDTVANRTVNGIGVFYWEGTWISAGGTGYEENRALWEKHGSGWATSAAAEYDPEDAGKWYGGCAVDNQAFFDADGRALESLKVFALVRQGNES